MGAFGSTDRKISRLYERHGFELFILRKDGSQPVFVPDDIRIEMKGTKTAYV